MQVALEAYLRTGKNNGDPITPEDMQPQRGPPGKNAPAAAGCKEEPPTEALTPSGRI